MRKIIYKAIVDRIKAAVPGVMYFSLWNNNTTYLTAQKGFRTPAVFVEFETIQWGQLQNRTRSADVHVRLHIVTSSLATPEDGGKYQDKALAHLSLIENISAAVQGLRGDHFNTFMLVESVTDHNHEQIMEHEECYVTRVTDTTAQRQPGVATGVAPSIQNKTQTH